MRLLLATALLLGALCAAAQRSPFNGLEVLPADSTGHYRILIGGHFHGASNNRSGYPAATLLANLDTINKLGAHLFLSTGDLFMDAENDRSRYERTFFSKLKAPLFNAPGNHDHKRNGAATSPPAMSIALAYLPALSPAGLVQLREGLKSIKGDVRDTSYLRQGRELFAKVKAFDADSQSMGLGVCTILDLETSNGSLSKEQLRELHFWEDAFREDDGWGGPFIILSHRPIWSEGDPQYSDLFKDNTRSVIGTNFHKDVYPILENIAEHAHVYWISGSLGGGAPSSIFFQPHAPNITYIQCAIRDEPRDALLIADVYPDTVKWSALSLTGQELLAPEAYDAAWWREHVGKEEGFSWRLLPYLVKTTLLRAEFWYGALAALLFAWLVRRLVRRGL